MKLFTKKIDTYLTGATRAKEGGELNDPPGKAFLDELIDLCDSVHHCARTFSRKKNGDFTKDSADSFNRISTATFALLMSNFETFQKKQFATIIDSNYALKSINTIDLAQKLEKEGCRLELSRVLVGGGDFGETGEIVADSMPGWHNPSRVNTYYRTIFPQLNFYSTEIISELETLWQLRHAIVHTAGIVSQADAIKVPSLYTMSNRRIVFGEGFFPAIGRRFHILIESVLDRLRLEFTKDYKEFEGESEQDREDYLNVLLGYSSRRKSWFRNND